MNIPGNLSKSCLLATIVFWLVIFTVDFEQLMIVVLLSIIPIFLVASIVIVTTICPIFWALETKSFDKTQIYKTCFPYYAITVFGFSVFGIIASGFDIYIIAFFASAYITTCQSWIWFAKEQRHEKIT